MAKRDRSGVGNTMPHNEAIKRQRESMARFYLGTDLATDQRVVAERKWCAPSKARAVQAACDIGLFSDDSKQTDLFSAATNKGK